MKIKNLLLLALFAVMSVSAWAAAPNNYVKHGIRYEKVSEAGTNVDVIVMGVANNANGTAIATAKAIELPATVEVNVDDVDYTLTITGFKNGWQNADATPGLETLDATGINTVTLAPGINPQYGLITAVTTLKFKGAIAADFTVPVVPATITTLDLTGITGTKAVKLGDMSSYSALETVTFGTLAAEIGANAFSGHTAIKTVTLGGDTKIGENAFKDATNLEAITMAKATEIGARAFESTKISEINLAAAKTIGNNAFQNTTVTEVTIPAQVETIADAAFYNINGLTTVTINLDNDVATTIGAWFNGGSIATLTINTPKVTKIAGAAFAASPISELTITAPLLEEIGSSAFAAYANTELDLSGLTALKTVANDVFSKNAYTSVKLEGTALDDDNFVNAQAWLTGCRGTLEEITFPDALTVIGTFNDYTALKAVDLPEGIKTIKDFAFARCTSLEAITIKGNVETIEESAFTGCSKLAAVDFSGATKLATIGKSAFDGTALTTVKIPATIKTLENSVFANNAELATVDFSEATALEKITNKAFDNDPKLLVIDLDKCSKLTLVDDDAFPKNKYTSVKLAGTALAGLDSDGNYYDNFSWPFNKGHIMAAAYNQEDALEMTLPAGLEKVQDAQFKEWTALKSISLPKGVTEIGKNAFEESGLTGIKIRENVKTIGESAFQNCADLALVNLSEATALTEIGKEAFADCTSLESIDFAGATALATIGESAFNGDALTTVKITGSIETIATQAFYNNKFESLDFSEAAALTTIGAKAFGVDVAEDSKFTTLNLTGATALATVVDNAFPANAYTSVLLAGTALDDAAVNAAFTKNNILNGAKESLTEITFPEGYDVSGFVDFAYFTILNSITLPADATEIPDYAFQNSNITSFEVGENITRIGKFAFQNSALESIDFTKATALTEIDDAAFANTASLKSVGLPKNLEVIPASAFEGSALESVKIKSHVKKILTAAFKNCAKLATVNFEDANALEQIKDQAFLGTALTTIDLSGATKLTLVDYNAFPQNKYTSVKLNGTALAGRDADGNYIDNFSYPFSKANIMANAYNQDGALEMTLPAGLEKVEASQFKEWTALKEISLPKAVTEIGASAFQASGLTGIKIRENVKTIGDNAFEGCVDLATVNMSEAAALTTIGDFAFANCYYKDPATEEETGLASIAIPAAVTTIGESAFANDALLATADFSLAAALTSIDENAFDGTALTVIDLSACTELATVYDSSFPKNNYTKILLNGTALTTLDPVEVWMSNWATATGDDPTCKTTLKEITLPAKVTKIPEKFLADFTGLKEVSLPKECTTIESYAFAGSGLTGIKIRSKVQTIGEGAFVDCENLATANFSEATALIAIAPIAFKNTAVKEVVIPANADDEPLLIGDAAFKNSKLKSFSAKSWAGSAMDAGAPDGKVADNLFENSKLNGIAIPATMTEIGDYAFADCKKLAVVTFKHAKKALKSIGDYAFKNCEALEALDLSTTKLEKIESVYPFMGCTALATITFPEELKVLDSYALFADCPIENFDAPNLVYTGEELFGVYSEFDDEDGTFKGYQPRDKDHANTTLKTVRMAGSIPGNCFAYCTALEEVEWLGFDAAGMAELKPSLSPGTIFGGGTTGPVAPNAFLYCTALKTFTYMPENNVEALMVSDNAFIGCTPYVMFATNTNYVDWIAANHRGAAPVNTTFGDVSITKVKTVQDKANAKQFVAKYVNNGQNPVYIDSKDAKLYSIYVDGDAAYFQACRTINGYYIIPAQEDETEYIDGVEVPTGRKTGWGSHVILKTDEAKEVEIKQLSMLDAIKLDLVRYMSSPGSIAYDDVYDSQKGDDLAKVQYGANVQAGSYLYRLTNTAGQGFGFTAFTGSTIKEGQFFVACEAKPAGAGRLAEVWLDEDGKVISGDVTGIESVEKIDVNNGAIYNLQGVRVDNPVKGGLYIQNGKKIVVK